MTADISTRIHVARESHKCGYEYQYQVEFFIRLQTKYDVHTHDYILTGSVSKDNNPTKGFGQARGKPHMQLEKWNRETTDRPRVRYLEYGTVGRKNLGNEDEYSEQEY